MPFARMETPKRSSSTKTPQAPKKAKENREYENVRRSIRALHNSLIVYETTDLMQNPTVTVDPVFARIAAIHEAGKPGTVFIAISVNKMTSNFSFEGVLNLKCTDIYENQLCIAIQAADQLETFRKTLYSFAADTGYAINRNTNRMNEEGIIMLKLDMENDLEKYFGEKLKRMYGHPITTATINELLAGMNEEQLVITARFGLWLNPEEKKAGIYTTTHKIDLK